MRYVQYALNRGHSYDEVWSQLRDGNALKSFDEVFKGDIAPASGTGQGGAITNATDLLEQYAVTVGRLGEVVQERDYLRGELEQEREAHSVTRERAATAEERARLVEASKQLPSPSPMVEPRPVVLWRWGLIVVLVAIVALLVVLAVQGVG